MSWVTFAFLVLSVFALLGAILLWIGWKEAIRRSEEAEAFSKKENEKDE